MAILFITKTVRSNLPNVNIVNGQITLCTDTKEYYYDNGNTVRIQSSDIEVLNKDSDRITMLKPVEDTVYIVDETSCIYRYKDGSWSQVVTSDKIADIVTAYTEMITETMTYRGKVIAPRTHTRAIYTAEGDLLEDVIKNITSVGLVQDVITATKDNQCYFKIPVPFKGYFTGGNHIVLFHKKVLVSINDYIIDKDAEQFQFPAGIAKDDYFDVLFLYHSKIPPKTNSYVDGGYISDKSIPIGKLTKITNDYNVNDPYAIPTAQAVSALYSAMTARIDRVSPNSLIHIKAQGDPYQIYLSIPGYTLNDGNTLVIRTIVALARNCKVKINGLDAVPIYVDENPIDENMVAAGTVINLRYNAGDGKFYLTNGEVYKFKSFTNVYTATAGESVIDIGINGYQKDIDNLRVYQNNIPLLRDLNFTINNGKIYLIDYTTDDKDVFFFEVTRIVKNFE